MIRCLRLSFKRLALPATGLLLTTGLIVQSQSGEWHARLRDWVPPASRGGRRVSRLAASRRVSLAEGRVVAYPGAEVVVGTEVAGPDRPADREGEVGRPRGRPDRRVELGRPAGLTCRVRRASRRGRGGYPLLRSRGPPRPALLAKNATAPQNLDVNLRGLELARARRSAAIASRDRLDALIAKTRITAPIDGVVTARHVQAGEIAEPGTAVVTIADLNRLRIEAEVDEFDTARVALGPPVTITAEGYGPTKWRGTVEEIPDSVVGRRTRPADPGRPIDARVLPVKIALTEPTPLKLGQRIDVEIASSNPGTR